MGTLTNAPILSTWFGLDGSAILDRNEGRPRSMHSFYSCARSNRVSSEPPPGFRRRDATAAEEKKADAAFGRACCFSCCPPRSRRVRNENSGGQTGRLIARVFAVKMFSERTIPILSYSIFLLWTKFYSIVCVRIWDVQMVRKHRMFTSNFVNNKTNRI